MKALNVFVAAVLSSFSLPLISQNQTTPHPAACGDLLMSMAVDLDNTQHSIARPETGKALIYFIQDVGMDGTVGYPTTEIGIDGKWVGANRKNSYFAVSVEPGEHHLCATIQGSWARRGPEFSHFTAEPGRIYYFRTRFEAQYLSLTAADSDEAIFLIGSYSLAKAHPKE